jgi:pimeloyl-ACP methyl ester carboxylesterase
MKTQFLERPEGKIAYEVSGAGPLVVAMPSMGDVRGEYRFLAPRMTAAGFTFVSMDMRGQGESDARWSDYSVSALGSDMVALIRKFNASRAIVIGTSMGAAAAVCAAAEAPDLIAGIVLVGPFVRNEGRNELMITLFQAMFADPWGAAFWGMYYPSLYPTRKPDDFATYLANLKANLRERGRLHALRKLLAADRVASDRALDTLKTPALVLMGSRDPDFQNPESEAQIVAQRLRSPYQMMPGAGHYPHAEMPEVVAPVMIDFAKQVTGQK